MLLVRPFKFNIYSTRVFSLQFAYSRISRSDDSPFTEYQLNSEMAMYAVLHTLPIPPQSKSSLKKTRACHFLPVEFSANSWKMHWFCDSFHNEQLFFPSPCLGGGFKVFDFHPDLGKIPILTVYKWYFPTELKPPTRSFFFCLISKSIFFVTPPARPWNIGLLVRLYASTALLVYPQPWIWKLNLHQKLSKISVFPAKALSESSQVLKNQRLSVTGHFFETDKA